MLYLPSPKGFRQQAHLM